MRSRFCLVGLAIKFCLALALTILSSGLAYGQNQLPIVSGTVSVPLNQGSTSFLVVLNQNVTSLILPTGAGAGPPEITITFVQNSTGGYTVSGAQVNLAAGAKTVVQWSYDSYTNTWAVLFSSAAVTGTGGTAYASAFPGATADVKIANCLAALPSTGGTCDARGLTGAQSFVANPFAALIVAPGSSEPPYVGFTSNKKVTLLLGDTTITSSATLDIPADATIIGNGTTQTIFAYTGSTYAVQLQGNQNTVGSHFRVDTSGAGSTAYAFHFYAPSESVGSQSPVTNHHWDHIELKGSGYSGSQSGLVLDTANSSAEQWIIQNWLNDWYVHDFGVGMTDVGVGNNEEGNHFVAFTFDNNAPSASPVIIVKGQRNFYQGFRISLGCGTQPACAGRTNQYVNGFSLAASSGGNVIIASADITDPGSGTAGQLALDASTSALGPNICVGTVAQPYTALGACSGNNGGAQAWRLTSNASGGRNYLFESQVPGVSNTGLTLYEPDFTITDWYVDANHRFNTAYQIISTLASGTSPFSVASTTVVANLNAALLNGTTWTAPGAIGGTTPAAGSFTSLANTGPIAGNATTGNAESQANNYAMLTSDFTDSSSASLQAITGLSFTLSASQAQNVPIQCHISWSQATQVSDSFGVQSQTINPTRIDGYGSMTTAGPGVSTAAVRGVLTDLVNTTATAIVTATPTVATVNVADLYFTVQNPSNASSNVIQIMVSQATAADLIVVKAGSTCRAW